MKPPGIPSPAPTAMTPSALSVTSSGASAGGIELASVRKFYGSTLAVDLPELAIPAGSFTVLVGPSGCGKSTLLRTIAGLETAEGQIRIDGHDVTATPPGSRNVAMVFQDFALYPHMTVARNIGFGLMLEARHRDPGALSGPEIRRRVNDTCELLGLAGKLNRRPRELSGGERQRVALARAIVRKKPILLLDEPLSNLDAHLRTQARAELIRLHREVEGTFVLVTHDQMEALSMGTHIVILNKGRLEQAGAPEDIWRHPKNLFVARFLGSPSMNILPCDTTGAGRDALVGWRPADGVVVDTDLATTGPGTVFDGVVDIVEFVGDRRIAYCAGTSGSWNVELPSVAPVAVGQRISVRVHPELLHYFASETGLKL